VTFSCLIDDFRKAFIERFKASDDDKNSVDGDGKDGEKSYDLPPSDFVMKSIIDETNQPPEYIEKMKINKKNYQIDD